MTAPPDNHRYPRTIAAAARYASLTSPAWIRNPTADSCGRPSAQKLHAVPATRACQSSGQTIVTSMQDDAVTE